MILTNKVITNKIKVGLINVFNLCWNSKYRHTLFRPFSCRPHSGAPDSHWSHESKHLSSVHPSFILPVWDDKAHPDAPLARARQTLNSFAAANVSIYFHDAAAATSNLCFICVVSAVDDWRWFLPNTSAQACKNLYTCPYDACIVKPYICLLLLIPSSENVITPLASQTPPESKCVFCVYMYL